jgi:uncharacterized membrane protein (DUF373 family)
MPTLTPMMGFRGHVSFVSEGVPFAQTGQTSLVGTVVSDHASFVILIAYLLHFCFWDYEQCFFKNKSGEFLLDKHILQCALNVLIFFQLFPKAI